MLIYFFFLVPNKYTHVILHEFHSHNPTCIWLPTSEGNTELLEVPLKENASNFARHLRHIHHHYIQLFLPAQDIRTENSGVQNSSMIRALAYKPNRLIKIAMKPLLLQVVQVLCKFPQPPRTSRWGRGAHLLSLTVDKIQRTTELQNQWLLEINT